jgi:threonine dehydratase
VIELDMALVTDARRALDGRIRRTPIEASDAAGAPVFLKLEALQLTGSFKIRGAWFVLSRLSADERQHGIVTCSAGNHGKATARVARELGIPAEIHVPRDVDPAKYQAIVALGARVIRSDFEGYDDTERLARAAAAQSGRPFLSAFDDASILAANGGTVAAEVVEDCPEARSFLIEPSAAVTVAAILAGKAGRLESPAVAVLTGRNVALSTVRRILAA